jgi:cytochrome c556
MIRKTALGLAALVCATASLADPVETRRAAMDQIRFGAATLVPMLRGDAEFDAVKAELALRMTYAGAMAFDGDHFPEGATSRGANPAIWENLADFDARRANFVVTSRTAASETPADLDALRAAYQPLLDQCASCHTAYRIKDN